MQTKARAARQVQRLVRPDRRGLLFTRWNTPPHRDRPDAVPPALPGDGVPRSEFSTINGDRWVSDVPFTELADTFQNKPEVVLRMNIRDEGGKWSEAWIRVGAIYAVRDLP